MCMQKRMQVFMYSVCHCCAILTFVGMLLELPRIKFHENRFSGLWAVYADRNDEANRCISVTFHYEQAKNELCLFSCLVDKIVCTEMRFFIHDTECCGTVS
jgi:hypothetical protein